MKKKRDQLTAFLLSALLLITGSAVGTKSAWADEKSPPSSIARCEQAGISKGFALLLTQRTRAGSTLFRP